MSQTRKSIYFLIFAAMFIWAADAAIDAVLLYSGTGKSAQDLLYLSVPTNEVVERLSAMTVFVLLGSVVVWLIHQHHRAEVATGQSARRYEMFFERNRSVMLLIDAETGQIADANQAACKFYGFLHGELTSQNIGDINVIGRDGIADKLREAREGETSFFQFRHQLANGDIRDVEVHTGPIDDEGRLRLLSVIHDVTERRHIQEALERSRTRLVEAERVASLGHWEMDLITKECFWSQQCARLFGHEPETVRLTQDFLLQCIHPEDREDVNREIRRLAAEGGASKLSHRVVWPNGEVRHMDVQLKAFEGSDGDVVRMMGATMDVTDRRIVEEQLRRSELQYRTLIETVPLGIQQIGCDGTVEFCNARFYEIVGYEPDGVIGRKVWDVVGDATEGQRLRSHLESVVCDQPEPHTYTGRNIRSDGQVIDIEVDWDYRLDEDGELIGFIAVVSDCTERKRAEQAIMDYQSRLKDLALQLSLTEERQRRRFASMLHDGIGQELFAVKTNLGLMKRLRSGDECDDLIAETQQLVDKTLKDARNLTFELSPPILQEIGLVAALRWLARRFESAHGLRCRVEVEDPGVYELDDATRSMLYHGVRELLFNVVKHAQASRACVRVLAREEVIRLEVEDDGVGFSDDPAAASKSKSGGFGLFNIRERLASAAGHMERESQPGEGSKVALVVPLAAEMAKET
ncbi:MAG: PAS domain S-box protein [Planctomycetes bacterium]|jgi:PAS domain S-box-containing protein|nr:PAS domain S-box protein [Phycisphaerae bacterium]NBB94146.1 PAS domain S-box protein [Planctomycetota bacterium]